MNILKWINPQSELPKEFKLEICVHDKTDFVGRYYSLHLAQFSNCLDQVFMYEIRKCSRCGKMIKWRIGIECFPPSMHRKSTKEDEFISKLRGTGFCLEYELNIKINDLALGDMINDGL